MIFRDKSEPRHPKALFLAKLLTEPQISLAKNSSHAQYSLLMTTCKFRTSFFGLLQHPEMPFLFIKDILVCLRLPMESLKGYCFDGDSNMSVRFKRVQARLKETQREVRLVAD